MSTDDYPEHLNPFDDNYNGVAEPPSNKHKYNTWSSSRTNRVRTEVAKPRPTFLEKPWAALNISPKGKIVRRLTILKTAVERFATKKTRRLSHSSSYTDTSLPARSNSVHNDFAFRIISPKLKEKIRQQAFSSSLNRPENNAAETTEKPCGTESEKPPDPSEKPSTPEINGRLTLSLKLDAEDSPRAEDSSPTSPETEKDVNLLGARPKARKKKPPPPPPQVSADTPKTPTLERSNGLEAGEEESHSANSSITQELEKYVSSEEDNSLTEVTRPDNPCQKSD